MFSAYKIIFTFFFFPGDQVLEWNGIALTGRTYEEVQRIIASSADEVEIVIRWYRWWRFFLPFHFACCFINVVAVGFLLSSISVENLFFVLSFFLCRRNETAIASCLNHVTSFVSFIVLKENLLVLGCFLTGLECLDSLLHIISTK